MKEIGKKDPIDTSFSKLITIKELNKPYVHKIIDGPSKFLTCYYPTIKDNKPTWALFNPKDYNNNAFSRLAEIHEAIVRAKMIASGKTEEEAGKFYSALRPQAMHHCLILDKSDSVPVIQHAAYKLDVKRQMFKIWKTTAINSTQHLKNGLSWMVWLDIRKKLKDESKSDKLPFNIEYNVQVEEVAETYKNKVPVDLFNLPMMVDSEKNQIIIKSPVENFEVPAKDVFSELEWSAIVNYEHSLDDLIQPTPDAQVQEKLNATPLYIAGQNAQGKDFVILWKEVLDEATRRKIALPPISTEIAVGSYLPPASAPEPAKLVANTNELDTILGNAGGVEQAEVVDGGWNDSDNLPF